jgi:hypothetical protein
MPPRGSADHGSAAPNSRRAPSTTSRAPLSQRRAGVRAGRHGTDTALCDRAALDPQQPRYASSGAIANGGSPPRGAALYAPQPHRQPQPPHSAEHHAQRSHRQTSNGRPSHNVTRRLTGETQHQAFSARASTRPDTPTTSPAIVGRGCSRSTASVTQVACQTTGMGATQERDATRWRSSLPRHMSGGSATRGSATRLALRATSDTDSVRSSGVPAREGRRNTGRSESCSARPASDRQIGSR